MSSVFSKIIAGDIPCYKIAEDDHYFSFLDIHPLAKGHTLVIPKKEIDYIFDIDDDSYQGLFLFAKKISLAIKKVIPCEKVGIAVIGLEVLHAHIHLIPLNSMNDINFSSPKLKLDSKELAPIAEKISKEVVF